MPDKKHYDSDLYDALTLASNYMSKSIIDQNSNSCGIKYEYKIDIVYLEAERIIFNDPATIVYWTDKTRTVVKCQKDDVYDPVKGLALCYMKKATGNKSGPFNKALKESGAYERIAKTGKDDIE